jgi:hypothetical protein
MLKLQTKVSVGKLSRNSANQHYTQTTLNRLLSNKIHETFKKNYLRINFLQQKSRNQGRF